MVWGEGDEGFEFEGGLYGAGKVLVESEGQEIGFVKYLETRISIGGIPMTVKI